MTIWQTKGWGEMLVKSKQAEEVFEIDGIFVEKRSVGAGEYGLFVLGLKDFISQETSDKLINLAKEKKVLFIQVESIKYTDKFIFDERVFSNWKRGVYKKFITPYTAVIDLEKTEEEVLMSMKPKGRYNIRLAEKKGVDVKIVAKNEGNLKEFFNLMEETTSRDGFYGNSLDYYKIFLEEIKKSELIFAYKDEKVIAAGIFVFDGDMAIYYYGASSGDKNYRNIMAPYLLQWEAIRYAKSIGCKIYDFLGIATPGDANSSLAGVSGFKSKLTKDIRWVSDSYIFINKKFKYFIINILRKLKR